MLVPSSSPQVAGFLPSPGTVRNEPENSAAAPAPAPEQSRRPSPETVEVAPTIASPVVHPRLTPLSPRRFGLQATIDETTNAKLRLVHELLGFPFGTGHIAEVLDRALDALLERLEKRKFATTESPRPARDPATPRTIPAAVKRAVKARDGNQCTYRNEHGRRCPERSRLEFEHIRPIARGGTSVVSNIRLLCRAHNQLEAERAFGPQFMEHKRRVNSARDARPTRH